MSVPFSLQSTVNAVGKQIHTHRLMDLPVAWADELVFPHYGGLSVYNFAHTLAQTFGVDSGPALDPVVWGDEGPPEVSRVVVVITDGLGYHTLTQTMSDRPSLRQTIHELTQGRGPIPLTSVLPSTTATVLPTLWSGAVPAVHGMLGTILHLREFGAMGDMLTYRPHIGQNTPDAFGAWGHPAEQFVTAPSIPQRLGEAGVSSHLLLDYRLMGTGLSRILHRGVSQQHPHGGSIDAWMRLHDVLRATRGERCYVSFYWPNVDGLSHMYGARSPYVVNEMNHQMAALRDLLDHDDVKDGQTVVFILADHGHADTSDTVDLVNDQKAAIIRDNMRQPLGGEARFAYVYARDAASVVETVNEHYADHLVALEAEAAFEAGLFGPGELHPEALHRVGDVILTGRPGVRVVDAEFAQSRSISRHGGLADAEMLVPLMWAKI